MTRCSAAAARPGPRRGSMTGPLPGKDKTGYGNNWVIAGIVVTLPFCSRPVCLPVLFRLVVKGTSSKSRLWLARRMAESLAGALPGRTICVTGDAAYAGKELRKLPGTVTWTTRLRKDAALHELPPPRTGRRGRPRVKGARLPALAALAAGAAFTPVTVTRYRKTATVQAAAFTCLGIRPSAPARSRSSSSATAPGTATTLPWSPPAWTRPPPVSSSGTPRGGASRSRSRTPSRSSAPGRPATAPPARSGPPSRSP